MTNAAVPTLLLQPEIAAEWLPKVLSRDYDKSFKPAQRQARRHHRHGHDREAGRHRRARQLHHARCRPAPADPARNTSSPGTSGSCRRPCATRSWCWRRRRAGCRACCCRASCRTASVNALRFQRLKDKLGNRSNASSEVEFQAAHGWLIGEEGRGVPNIIEMVTGTRLDCAVGSAGLMRLALGQRHPPLPPPHRVPEEARRPAADEPGAGRPGARRGGRNGAVVPAGAQLRPRLRPACGGLAPAHDAGHQVLGLQDGAGLRLRGHGVPGRQRLRRGGADGPRSIASCRSTPSGRARATSWRSTCCACCSASPRRLEIVMEDLSAAVGSDRHLKAQLERVQAILHEPRLLDQRGRSLTEALATPGGGHDTARACAGVRGRRLHRHPAVRAAPRQTYGQGLDAADTRAIVERALPVLRSVRRGEGPTPRRSAAVLVKGPVPTVPAPCGSARHCRTRHGAHDLAQGIDEAAALVGPQHRQDALIHLRRQRLDAAQDVLALGVRRTAYMRASRRVRLRCSSPFFTSRRTTSARVDRSTPVCSTRPVWLTSGILRRRRRGRHTGAASGPTSTSRW